jgi:hypothetical protein
MLSIQEICRAAGIQSPIIDEGEIMEHKTPEQIYYAAEKKSDTWRGQRVIIKRLFRQQDESYLWPIRGRFNATERAFRRVNAIEQASGSMPNLEYALSVDNEISKIVNDPRSI